MYIHNFTRGGVQNVVVIAFILTMGWLFFFFFLISLIRMMGMLVDALLTSGRVEISVARLEFFFFFFF